MKHFKMRVAFLALALLVFVNAEAYETALSPQAVREAYFLGLRNDETTARFLVKYVTHLPAPKAGPHVFEIELYTPYSQIVDHFRHPPLEHSAQQADQDYRAQNDTLRVRTVILFPLAPSHVAQYSWQDFTIHFRQQRDGQEKIIQPIEVRHEGYSVGAGKSHVRSGVQMVLLFSVADVTSAPARIEVQTPDGQHVMAEFDLEKLR